MARKGRMRQLSAEDIQAIQSLARLLRKLLKIHDLTAPNVLHVLDQLKKIFPRLILRIVPDTSLREPARAYPRTWTIRIRQSVHEALLRGQWLARWTLCHELGHVLRAHPGLPFRERDGQKRKLWKEREANVFVTEFLIPPHLSAQHESVDAISRIFQVSSHAAEIAHFERERDRKKLHSRIDGVRGSVTAIQSKRAYYTAVEDQATVVFFAITQTIAEAKEKALPVEAFRNNALSTATLASVGSRLLLDAYDSFHRSVGTSGLRCEAALVAAILYMRPIREIGAERSFNPDVLMANQSCAQLAIGRLLRIACIDGALPNPDDPVSFESSYLDSLLTLADRHIQNATTILNIPQLPDYKSYNLSNDIQWGDIHYADECAFVAHGRSLAPVAGIE